MSPLLLSGLQIQHRRRMHLADQTVAQVGVDQPAGVEEDVRHESVFLHPHREQVGQGLDVAAHVLPVLLRVVQNLLGQHPGHAEQVGLFEGEPVVRVEQFSHQPADLDAIFCLSDPIHMQL